MRLILVPCLWTVLTVKRSLDGEVKLWDLRGAKTAVETWTLDANGLSAFDVHPLADVFAGYVRICTLCSICTDPVPRTSAITPLNWRSQRITVHSLPREAGLSGDVLARANVPTGHSVQPSRALPSPFIPRTSSFVFHPTEMLYGVGEPDGTCKYLVVCAICVSNLRLLQCVSWDANLPKAEKRCTLLSDRNCILPASIMEFVYAV